MVSLTKSIAQRWLAFVNAGCCGRGSVLHAAVAARRCAWLIYNAVKVMVSNNFRSAWQLRQTGELTY
jgi:hypothetical protein